MKSKVLAIFFILLVFPWRGTWPLLGGFTNKALDKSVRVDKIVVLKSKRILQLWHGNKLIKSYRIALGRNPIGHKQYEGDNRTPEGLYYINDKNPHSRFHKNLGISYPNKQDIINAGKKGKRPGGQIKIHGDGGGPGLFLLEIAPGHPIKTPPLLFLKT